MHAGVLLIDDKTGATAYFDYGRYYGDDRGVIVKVPVPNVTIGKDGLPTDASLKALLARLSHDHGGGRVRGAYVKNADYRKSQAYAMGRLRANKKKTDEPYSITNNNCGDFAQDVIEAGGGGPMPWKVDPRPNSYMDEMADDFPDFTFTPSKAGGKLGWQDK